MGYPNDDGALPTDHSGGGRLASDLVAFEEVLNGQGYVPATVRQKIDLVAAFCAWVEECGLPIEVLGKDRGSRFLTEYRRGGARRGDVWTIRQFVGYLADIGRIPTVPPPIDSTVAGDLVRAFGDFLRTERGLSASTLTNYLPIVRDFLEDGFHGEAPQFNDLRAADVHRFIVRRAQVGSLARAKLVVTTLRSFLRFLQQRGLLSTDLAAAVPGVAGW